MEEKIANESAPHLTELILFTYILEFGEGHTSKVIA